MSMVLHNRCLMYLTDLSLLARMGKTLVDPRPTNPAVHRIRQ
jgi:hypothetical protein